MLVASSQASSKYNDDTLKALKKDGVIPDVIPDSLNFEPKIYPSASFDPKDDSLVVRLGNFIPQPKTHDHPALQFLPEPHDAYGGYGAESKLKYTLCITDPDAKSRETHEAAEFLHWLITDVTIPDDGSVDLKSVKTLVEYYNPTPPKGTGKHRYVLLLFQNGGKEPKNVTDRPHWGYEVEGNERVGAMRYAGENDLTLVGANFFVTEYYNGTA